MSFALRTTGEPTALAATVRQVVRELDSNLPVTEVGTQSARSQATLGQERLYARLVSFFGGLALLLAAIGLSGVLAYSVVQRTNEIGIRMALGAQPGSIARMILREAAVLLVIGLAVGTALTLAATRAAGALFFGLQPNDPLTMVMAAVLLTAVAVAASYLPARRAAKVEPITALRYE
jgi:ABC-type antimicrobial peptide transport system permease subunit